MCSKTSVPWGFLEDFAYSHLLAVVVVCSLLLFPSFHVVVCLPTVSWRAKYFLFFIISVSCRFRRWCVVCLVFVLVVGGVVGRCLLLWCLSAVSFRV